MFRVVKLALPIFASLLLLSGAKSINAQSTDVPPGMKPYTPKSIPFITFYDEAGNVVSLEKFTGKVILLNFWATWCNPCVEEMPDLDLLQRKYGADGLAVVPVSEDIQGAAAVQKFYAQYGISNLPIYVDYRSAAYNALGLGGLPGTILIDRDGFEAARIEGLIDWNEKGPKLVLEDLLARKRR